MFPASLTDQQIWTLYGIAVYLTAAPLLVALAALFGYCTRRARANEDRTSGTMFPGSA